jgi:hypothetical protein
LALSRRTEDAYDLLKKAYTANVFYHDVPKKTAIKLGLIGNQIDECLTHFAVVIYLTRIVMFKAAA